MSNTEHGRGIFETRREPRETEREVASAGAPAEPRARIRAFRRALWRSWRLYLEEAVEEHPDKIRERLAHDVLDREAPERCPHLGSSRSPPTAT